MKNRDRAFSAIIENGKIVMVYHKRPNRNFWTLPGGGVEKGESLEEASIREAFEEVNLNIKIIRFLYECDYSSGIQYCFLAEALNSNKIKAGYDPEVGLNEQSITEAIWRKIEEVKDDKMISVIINKLTVVEKEKYMIN